MRTSGTALLVLLLAACGGGGADGDADADADGDADADADGDADGHGDADDADADACGDPEVAARYDACRSAEGEDACAAAGGRWGPVGLYPEPVCQCPTGQGACPCTRGSDCLSVCIAEPTSGASGCEGVVEGRCSPVSLTMGCHCFFDDEGHVTGLCVD